MQQRFSLVSCERRSPGGAIEARSERAIRRRRVQETLPKRYRGHLEVDMAICTNCKACERECPISCIAITDSEEPDKKRWMTQFDIDLAKCMYCGICSEVCPTGAIHHSPEFEGVLSQSGCNGPTFCVGWSPSSFLQA